MSGRVSNIRINQYILLNICVGRFIPFMCNKSKRRWFTAILYYTHVSASEVQTKIISREYVGAVRILHSVRAHLLNEVADDEDGTSVEKTRFYITTHIESGFNSKLHAIAVFIQLNVIESDE